MKFPRRLLHSSQTSSWDYDIMICGGGIIGATLASKLLHMSGGTLKIGLIDNQSVQKESYEQHISNKIPDKRVYAFSPKSINILRSIPYFDDTSNQSNANVTVWDKINVNNRARSYQHMQIWEEHGKGVLKLSATDINVKELGYIVEDRLVNTVLYNSIAQSIYKGSIDCIFNSTVTSINVPDSKDGTYFTEPVHLTYTTSNASSSNNKNASQHKTLKCR